MSLIVDSLLRQTYIIIKINNENTDARIQSESIMHSTILGYPLAISL